jgi:4-hydroxy-tetrahydrodipicolinate synthase
MDKKFSGVYVIAVTPFHEDESIDEESLRSVVDFCIEAGAHGLVCPANVSEFFALSDEERLRVSRIVCEQVDGRIPVVLTVNGVSAHAAVELTKAANDLGADAIMAMPPPIKPMRSEGIFHFYEAISAATKVPVIVQNSIFVGTSMNPEFMVRLIDEIEHLHYIKEESDPCTHVATKLLDIVKKQEKLHGIVGGLAGRHLMNEIARGVCGTMPACDTPDAHAAIWNAHECGDAEEARRLFNRLLPLMNMQSLYPLQLYKEVLKRRGVIRSAKIRNYFQTPLDPIDHRELDVILSDIEDLLIVEGGGRK